MNFDRWKRRNKIHMMFSRLENEYSGHMIYDTICDTVLEFFEDYVECGAVDEIDWDGMGKQSVFVRIMDIYSRIQERKKLYKVIEEASSIWMYLSLENDSGPANKFVEKIISLNKILSEFEDQILRDIVEIRNDL